jgi:hypothetical protein
MKGAATMICESCKMAGDFNAKGKPVLAEQLHTNCEYKESCPCLHRTGTGIIIGREG